MRTVAVTGSKGVIGTVISRGLAGWEIRGLDLPECDVRDYAQVLTALRGAHAVVHLAWDGRENYLSDSVQPDNHLMAHNVYAAARAVGVGRVVAASSVHADRFWPRRDAPLRIEDPPVPDSPYGASKVFVEALGRFAAHQGGEVVCIRFGGVNRADTRPPTEPERSVWLSHRDCRTLIARALVAPLPASGYAALYGISGGGDRLHDLTNALGWYPRGCSAATPGALRGPRSAPTA